VLGGAAASAAAAAARGGALRRLLAADEVKGARARWVRLRVRRLRDRADDDSCDAFVERLRKRNQWSHVHHQGAGHIVGVAAPPPTLRSADAGAHGLHCEPSSASTRKKVRATCRAGGGRRSVGALGP
jgi:hypothetical protein